YRGSAWRAHLGREPVGRRCHISIHHSVAGEAAGRRNGANGGSVSAGFIRSLVAQSEKSHVTGSSDPLDRRRAGNPTVSEDYFARTWFSTPRGRDRQGWTHRS